MQHISTTTNTFKVKDNGAKDPHNEIVEEIHNFLNFKKKGKWGWGYWCGVVKRSGIGYHELYKLIYGDGRDRGLIGMDKKYNPAKTLTNKLNERKKP